MTRIVIPAAAAALALAALGGCQKPAAPPAATASETVAALPSTVSASGPCPFARGQGKDWQATLDRSPPVPEGGRPLGLKGQVEVAIDGQSAMLTPGMLDAAGQHFTLELSPDASSTKGWRQVSTSVYPAPAATRAVIDCGGAALAEVAVETVQ